LDNLTHSLVGAALAQAALPAAAADPRRRLFLAVGVVAANLPDADLLYVGITPPPVGYLLHHRGHTHTVVGLVAQGLFFGLLLLVVPAVRRRLAGARARLWGLIAAGLATHLLLDAGNSYGVHPFHPFDSRWYYGDAVFILEPWLWVLLAVPLAWNAGTPLSRAVLFASITVLPGLMALGGMVRAGPLAALTGAGLALAWATRRLSYRGRPVTALAASVVFISALFGLSAVAEARARRLVQPDVRGQLLDIVLSPNPADPLCWMAIAVERHEAAGEYVLHRGTLSLVPSWRPATECASYRFGRDRETRGVASGPAWAPPIREPLGRLRDLAARDCWVRAWLQFVRVPAFREREIHDLRFDNGGRDNFTALHLDTRPAGCPPHVTSWTLPRADLLTPGR
jgi:inner membrane protein